MTEMADIAVGQSAHPFTQHPQAGASSATASFALNMLPCVTSIAIPLQVGKVKLNPEQRRAVATFLEVGSGGPPVAIFGPPGTGKTVTLVEAALQVRLRPKCLQEGS